MTCRGLIYGKMIGERNENLYGHNRKVPGTGLLSVHPGSGGAHIQAETLDELQANLEEFWP